MKLNSSSKLTLPEELLTMIFYLFMALCGFVAGTRIWTAAGFPAVLPAAVLPHTFLDILLTLFAPAAVITFILLLMALFVIGWMLLPVILYMLGGAAGLFICSFFGVPVSITNFSVSITVSACFICTLAVACYIAVCAHRSSRQLTYTGGSCACTYLCRNVFLAALILFITDAIFAGIIFLQTFSA